MNRKQFLARSLQACAGCATLTALSPAASAREKEAPSMNDQQEAARRLATWINNWVADFGRSLDAELPADRAAALMRANGRACARRGPLGALQAYRGDLDGLLAWFRTELGPQSVDRRDDGITISWDSCLCPLVKDVADGLSPTYCHCTEGWFEAVLGMVVGSSVTVQAIETIKRGDSRCRVVIRL